MLLVDAYNRVQAGDFKSYAALKNVTENPEIETPRPKTDMEELSILGKAAGLGEAYFHDSGATGDDEFDEFAAEIGYTDR